MVRTVPPGIPDCGVLSSFLSPREDGSLELSLEYRCPEESVAALTMALRGRSERPCAPITSLYVHKSFLTTLSQVEQVQVLECLPDLEEMSFAAVTISASALVVLLAQARHLKRVHLDRVVIVCRAADSIEMANRLGNGISQLRELKDFHLSFGSDYPAVVRNRDSIPMFVGRHANLDALVNAVSTVKALDSVYFGRDSQNRRSTLLPSAFASLAQSTKAITLRNMAISPCHVGYLDSVSLQSLNLIQTDLADRGALALSERIAEGRLPSLKKLYVAGNGLTDKGALAIVEAIRTNDSIRRSVEVLDLHENSLTSLIGSAISGLLRTDDCGLTYLDLSCNTGFGDEGGVAVASALAKNARLSHLVLFNCGVGDRTARAVSLSLSRNRTLKRLNLYDNEGIGQHGVRSLLSCLQNHAFHLEWLELKTSHLPKSMDGGVHDPRRVLSFYLRMNREFRRGEALLMDEREYVESAIAKAAIELDLSAIFCLLSARPTLCSFPVCQLERSFSPPQKLCVPSASRFRKEVMVAKVFCNPQA